MTGAVLFVAIALFFMSLSSSFLLTAASMSTLALALSLNFGLAGTIVQERAPGPLRGRISAIFGLSFFGLMPIAGLLITSLSDLIGMRVALAISSICFGLGALVVLTMAGRTVCQKPVAVAPAPEAAPVA
jgi:MFS family permease